ncbi:hypothetical protein FC52_GL000551 [Lactobacillus pasteurii DSM 23907 = CRBIP 24.76]|uniref:Uncharacterized protein n=1 Tax=Lactobacillus pasteurii DSM 23907 = CRBIP 24.76 TaxID=1423790 RepID=I7LBW7_9LACO|nr:hypothetical protein [Lactobacillus pasteurii]KRK08850.1 hypothetical protein FC52_GL000551 [Lactobacillus pasteurii DSM 23907 = CRBIP 24.76]TDG76315.1 hypothetical protein C5L33_001074 [Lactobacillus pasteurii]CCI85961.1 Putative uncharacterized protein [Lactobacillus pasteurii DSM 23907 = CRBIP 24.76]
MTLNNFLELIRNINQNSTFYVKVDQKQLPLSKFTLSSSESYFSVGQNPMTKQKFIRLIKQIYRTSLPLYVNYDNRKIPIYGLQISIELGRIILM